jgi:hypothetical protein
MKTQHFLIAFILSVGAFSTSPVFAQTSGGAQSTTPPPTTTTAPADESEGLFRKGEWTLSPFGAYVNQAGGKWAGGLAATYFLEKHFGIGGSTYWTEGGGSFFDNLEAEGYFRLPVFKRLAPYAVGGIGYQFDREYSFQTLGGGIDFKLLKRFDGFSDIQYRFSNDHDKSPNGAFIRFGLRFSI